MENTTTADPGLYGPSSVTWQCHGDPIMWVAGIRALYLQALHPRAVRGVMENSDFKRDAWGRLLRTADFVGTLTYGTTEAAEHAGEPRPRDPPRPVGHRPGHRRALPRRRPRAAALDPLRADRQLPARPAPLRRPPHRRPGRPLRRREPRQRPPRRTRPGRCPRRHRPARRLLRADPARARPCGPDAHAVDDFLRGPPVHPFLVPGRNLLWPRIAGPAYGSLPGWAHQLYGRPAPAPRSVTRRLRLTGLVLRSIPAGLRWKLPPGHILKAMRRMGPGSRPSPYTLRTSAAILDRPGRA